MTQLGFEDMERSEFTVVELFVGTDGLALGLENAGFKTIFLNEIDKDCVETLK